MAPTTLKVLSSPYLLYLTSLISFTTAHLIIHRVKKHGPISFAPALIKLNSRCYALGSFLLFLALLTSFGNYVAETRILTIHSIVCCTSTSAYDETLRFIYHASKLYEYIDILNVLAAGSEVNTHFGFHHFTTPYLTYARVIKHPAGWKIFSTLNTFHHALMYAYFGGATVFTDIIEWTGCLQLTVGIMVDLYAISKNLGDEKACGGKETVWANVFSTFLLSAYFVLFWGDLRARWSRTMKENSERKVE